jgi:hypothetical protein
MTKERDGIAEGTIRRSQRKKGSITYEDALFGFDHGVGHPPLLLCNAKAPNCRNNTSLKDLSHYAEWPKVADAVIEAHFSV